MATLKQIERVAKERFIPAIEEQGFTYFKGKMVFARLHDEDIYDFLTFDTTRGGHLRANITADLPELSPSMIQRFPLGGGIVCGGWLNEDGLQHYSECWEMDDLPKTLDYVEGLFKQYAQPFLNKIKTRQDFLDHMYPSVKKQLSEELIQQILHPQKSYGFPPKA